MNINNKNRLQSTALSPGLALHVRLCIFAASPAVVRFDHGACRALSRGLKKSAGVGTDDRQFFDEGNIWGPPATHAPSDPGKQPLHVACVDAACFDSARNLNIIR
jgi:hypothetical protein